MKATQMAGEIEVLGLRRCNHDAAPPPSAIGTLGLRRMVAKRPIDNEGAKDAM
jgi:hypothetical protein